MFENTWNRIIDWFRDSTERSQLIRDFNKSAKNAFVLSEAPTLLKSSISKGESTYKHQFSHWFKTGFRIKAFSGRQLTKEEIIFIGAVILNDNILVRRLIVLGWDTLEIHGDEGAYGLKWQLKDYVALPK